MLTASKQSPRTRPCELTREGPGERGARDDPGEVDADVNRAPRAPGDEELDRLVDGGDERDEKTRRQRGPTGFGASGDEEPARYRAEDGVLGEVGALANDKRHDVGVRHPDRLEERPQQPHDGPALSRGLRPLDKRVPPDKGYPQSERDGPWESGPPRRVAMHAHHASTATVLEKCRGVCAGRADGNPARCAERCVPPSMTCRNRLEVRRTALEELLENSSLMR